MSTSPPYKILVCDSCSERVKWLEGLLTDHHANRLQEIHDWEQLKYVLRQASPDPIDLVILGLIPPGGTPPLPERALFVLGELNPTSHVIALADNPKLFDPATRRRRGLHVLDQIAINDWRVDEVILQGILADCLAPPRHLPTIDLADPTDVVLVEMISSLAEDGLLDRGKRVLSLIARDLWACQGIQVKRMLQGLSGAKVFRVDTHPETPMGGFALKMVSIKDEWKIRNEVSNWSVIEPSFCHFGLQRGVPAIQRPEIPAQGQSLVVNEAGWFSVAYQLLGGNAGKFLSLEDAYRLGQTDLEILTTGTRSHEVVTSLGEFTIKQVLSRLEKAWYGNASLQDDETALWDRVTAQHGRVLCPPPYRLTSKQKANLLASGEMLDRQGRRLRPATWGPDLAAVESWLKTGPPEDCRVLQPRRSLLSSVHGDLNSNNILLWLDEAQPFLIDFACFQQQGHTLQDFARLEVEVKYALMDRQEDAPEAFDFDAGRLPLWFALEEAFCSEGWESDARLESGNLEASLDRAANLVKLIRSLALGVWTGRSGFPREDPGFWCEYASALLYHTIRVIGYDSLSPFKRLLSVVGSARLINCLGRVGGA